MAAATDSTSDFPSMASDFSADNSQFHLSVLAQSPWSQIVRCDPECPSAKPSPPAPHGTNVSADSDCLSRRPESGGSQAVSSPCKLPDEASEGHSPSVKKHAWSKVSNAPGAPVVDVGSFIGAASWPALSEWTRVLSESVDSAKPLEHGSTLSQDPAMAQFPQKSYQNANANPAQNHPFMNRQRHPNRRSNNANGGSAFSGTESLHDASDRQEQTHKDPSHKSNREPGSMGWVSHGYTGNDHARHSFIRANGPHSRADNPHQNNQRNRGHPGDQDYTHYEWNSSRGYGGRNIQQQRRSGPRNFIRQPAVAPFMNLPHGYTSPMGYPDMGVQLYYVRGTPAEHIQGMPFLANVPRPAVFYPAPNPQLRTMLVRQIEYYFSGENLCKDVFLRRNMDEQGWVSISLIANFNRVKQMTNNIPFILDSIRGSSVVEIQGDKIRRRNDWRTWLLPNFASSTSNAETTAVSDIDNLAAQIRGVGLEGPIQQSD